MKLIMMRGLPASGKSTIAKEIIHNAGGGNVRINADLLRSMLHCDIFSSKNESITKGAMECLARESLSAGLNVIVDNTNLGDSHRERWSGIAKEYNARFEVVDLTSVPIEECWQRNRERSPNVPEHVITEMALQYKLWDIGPTVICDVDGTISDTSNRVHYVRGPKEARDWKSFFEGILFDHARLDILSLINNFRGRGYFVAFVSGRSEKYREVTMSWFARKGIYAPVLLMRQAHDHRPDTDVKRDILHKYFLKQDVLLVLDDRPSVLRMWESEGLRTIDVGNGQEF
jgi:predicted kinase